MTRSELRELILQEIIKLPIEIGDTILMGKFRNKKVVVKKIGKDELGHPTINGKKILAIRIPKIYESMKKSELKQIIREVLCEETLDFKVTDRVKLKPDVIKQIKNMFGVNDETAYVDYPGTVIRVFSSGLMIKWDNGQTNVNPKDSLMSI